MTETPDPQDKMKEASPPSLSKQAQKRLEGLTESQTSEAFAIAGIIDREIQKSGTFRDKLTDYAHAFARGEKFDALKGETIIRDMYQVRFDRTNKLTIFVL
jgi:hypothetical protein